MENSKFTLKVPELAKQLQLSLPQAYKLCRRADFPVLRLSERNIRIPVDGLRKWLEMTTIEGLAN